MKWKSLRCPKRAADYLLDAVSFDRQREILGIYGLMGSGRTEVFECIMGLRPEHAGTVKVRGETTG